MRTSCKGSITVYFSMILLFVFAFLGGLLLFCKHKIMETAVREDLEVAGFSTLGEYRQDWAKEYGLFVLDENQLLTGMQFYLDENRQHVWGTYEVNDMEIINTENLADPVVLQNQICLFMKERGFIDLLEEAMELLGQLQELEEEVNEADLKEAEELERIQALYAQLVTDLEGVSGDGYQNPYSINHLLEEDPAYNEVLEAFQSQQLSSQKVGILERGYDELDHVQKLCEDAVVTADELKKAVLDFSDPAKLPISAEQLESYRIIWEKNGKLCQEASAAIKLRISTMEEDTSPDEELFEKLIKLEEFDKSIVLAYEYREPENSWDLNSILNSLKGYSVDVETIAPDEERDLGLETEESTEEGELGDVALDESFESLFLTVEYSLGIFRNFREAAAEQNGEKALNLRGEEIESRFFNNEVEYLLVGAANEYRNVDGTRQRILAFRSVLNIGYLLTDAEKRAEIEALSATIGGILLPGIGNGVAYAMILVIWGMGEATMDYQVLIEGGKVPLWKNDESWQTDLLSVLSLDLEAESQESGMSYDQYLRLLLYMVGQENLLQRIQHLLFLNHQKQSLEEMISGYTVKGEAVGIGSVLEFTGEYAYDADS